ncbi:MFS transporter [Trinickia caryophylli]|uniref:Sugar phosphate permease n=1 Tax=Trinickia caryophylli TaxID=28094 RepID=A0A1X7EW30_TRICW|nr:MFS transporter [Trinickia caryophylli]PMS09712.1 MFS transporter [Trinickia caryophylli]TRX18482.1 MFS transporter [Trinickia caryophylli]WQE10729.1 MFS transporter [Trinickia caryophylli]SMF41102.1 Sugar phosphate permease [Trinickia caryophylli]GLU33104.1 MFS transporter [Trinickia caryophylli]
MFTWFKQISPTERRTFWACFGGWALDALDVQIFSLVIPAIIAEWAIGKTEAGFVSGATLVASALGGWIAGAMADRIGRVRTLQITVAFFSVFTFACAFAQNFPQFLVLKTLQGFGFGGEWAAGAVLMAETIRPEHRGKAMGTVQSAWAVGWGAAVLLYTTMFSFMPGDYAWRVMFGVGLLPALLILYVRRGVPEPVAPRAAASKPASAAGRDDGTKGVPFFDIFSPRVLRMTLIGALLGVGAHGGYYALMTWLPTYLKTERHLSVLGTGGYLAVIIVAFFCGCLASSQLLDKIGRRGTILLFSICCVATVLVYLFAPLSNMAMLFLGFPLGFFAAGIPASMGALFNELYPRGMRGTGVGFCYNFGRVASALFPVMVGHLAKTTTLGFAIGLDAGIAYAIVVFAVLMLPETRGRALADTLPDAVPAGPAAGEPARR